MPPANRCYLRRLAPQLRSAFMSPTILREGGFRLYFYSREEPRPHVHVSSSRGEAKFWLTPDVELAMNRGLRFREIVEVRRIIGRHLDEILAKWQEHFPG